METEVIREINTNTNTFKIDLIVWKPSRAMSAQFACIVFKIDLIVWKLFRLLKGFFTQKFV